jgi:Uma2 family endonuclease
MAKVLTPNQDQRLVYPGRTWEQFKAIQNGLEGCPGVRLSYYRGEVELFMPGQDHEFFKSVIAFLLEIFFVERGIDFYPTGSMDQEIQGRVFAQADESYCMGPAKPIPDLSIEVTFTSANLAKLERYLALGVPEVWFWEDGLFSLYHLHFGRYQSISQSEIPELSGLDMQLLTRCVLMAETSRLEAAKAFRQSLQNQ